MLTRWERPLSVGEQRHLHTRLARARDESSRAVLKAGGGSAAIRGPLAAATLLLSARHARRIRAPALPLYYPPMTAQIERTLFLYVANGVTTIRGMLGLHASARLDRSVPHGG